VKVKENWPEQPEMRMLGLQRQGWQTVGWLPGTLPEMAGQETLKMTAARLTLTERG